MLDAAGLRELLSKNLVGPAAKCAALAHPQAVMSAIERRACSIVGADRKMIRYCASRPADAAQRDRLRDIANERRHFGTAGDSSRCGERASDRGSTGSTRFIARKGSPQGCGTRAPMQVEGRTNTRWSLDFVHGANW